MVPTTDLKPNATLAAPAILGGGPIGKGVGPHVFNRVLDVNGDGLPDLISESEQCPRMNLHLYIHEGKKPDLLLSVTNGLGATDSVEYDHLGNKQSGVYTRMAPGTCVYPQYCVNERRLGRVEASPRYRRCGRRDTDRRLDVQVPRRAHRRAGARLDRLRGPWRRPTR